MENDFSTSQRNIAPYDVKVIGGNICYNVYVYVYVSCQQC